jgi:uncharacterized protein
MKHTREYFFKTYPTWKIGVHVRDIPSDGNSPDLQIQVFLPWSMEKAVTKTFPVVYICDGYWDMELASSIYPHLLWDKVIPEFIMVGLSYSGIPIDSSVIDPLRMTDLAPPSPEAAAAGNDYLSRLKNTVIPFVDSEYPTDPSFRAISGTSLGANFAVSALFRAPGLFHAAIALSPIFASYNRWIFALEEQYYRDRQSGVGRFLGKKPEFPVRLFSAVGDLDSPQIVQAAKEFQSVLERRKYRFLEHNFRLIPGEKHGGVLPEGLNRGFRHIFSDVIRS